MVIAIARTVSIALSYATNGSMRMRTGSIAAESVVTARIWGECDAKMSWSAGTAIGTSTSAVVAIATVAITLGFN